VGEAGVEFEPGTVELEGDAEMMPGGQAGLVLDQHAEAGARDVLDFRGVVAATVTQGRLEGKGRPGHVALVESLLQLLDAGFFKFENAFEQKHREKT